eukprot:5436577-Pyramimonas_sp.AAC.1
MLLNCAVTSSVMLHNFNDVLQDSCQEPRHNERCITRSFLALLAGGNRSHNTHVPIEVPADLAPTSVSYESISAGLSWERESFPSNQ